LPFLKILLNSNDVAVFLASSELCQKIKENVLNELFQCEAFISSNTENNINNHNNNILINKIQHAFPEWLAVQAPQEFGEIETLEIINGIITEKLQELKKKEEAIRLRELQKYKELERTKQLKNKKSKGKQSKTFLFFLLLIH